MADTKDNVHMQSFTDPYDDGSPVNEGPSLKQGTVADQLDMQRMGKTQQTKVLRNMKCSHRSRSDLTQRNFRFLTIFGFTMVLMATWEAQFSASQFAILNGGRAGAIWVYLGAFFGFLTAIASMAEMSSMSPTTGGQYRKLLRFHLGLASADKFCIAPRF
jgi:choline transport protein